MNRVLLVDDEIFARQGLRNLMDWSSCGFEVIGEAGNGEDALEMIAELRPELVITDIRMPVMDGLELIRRVTEERPDGPSFIIISGYDDFKYAQQAVRYGVVDFILKPIDEEVLGTTLRQLNDKLAKDKALRDDRERLMKERIVNSLITGEGDARLAVEGAVRLGIMQESAIRYTFVELNDNHPWGEAAGLLTQEQVKSAVRQALQALFGGDVPIHLHEHRRRIGILLTSAAIRDTCGDVRHYAERLQRDVLERLGQCIYVYAGEEVRGLTELRKAYLTAKEALQYKYIDVDRCVVVYDDVKGLTLHELDMDRTIYRGLIERIEENDKAGIRQMVDDIFGEFQAKRFAPEAVKMAIHHCVTDVIAVANRMDIDKAELQGLEPMVSWQDLNLSLRELKRLFTAFVSGSAERISKGRKENMKGSIAKIKHYIEQNYRDNISLKSLSNEFYMNPVYLGQLFKKTYGVYFNDFLLHLRVDEAKKLLRQTDLRIYEIAERVGFTSSDYFVTQFEKIEHMTPTEYRNTLQ